MTDTRPADQLRPVSIEPFDTGAAGSVMIAMGQTRVLCTASVEDSSPKWVKTDDDGNPEHGWVTAEYQMLPGSTPQRKRRGPDGRGTEIQRLIGRTLRAAVDLHAMPGLSVYCDCDVMKADGGTRTASITGAYVALAQAVASARARGVIAGNPILGPVSAISVGIVDGKVVLDLDYPLDSRAEVDLNVAMNHEGKLIEVQGTGERAVFDRAQLDAMLTLAEKGCRELMAVQQTALRE